MWINSLAQRLLAALRGGLASVLLRAKRHITSVGRGITALPRPVSYLGLSALLVIATGIVVQSVAPPKPLIVISDSGMFAEGSEFSGDSSLYLQVDYLAGDQLSQEEGSAPVYEMVLEGTPEGVLATLGDVFEVEGEAAQSDYYSLDWPGYAMGAEDWSGPSLVLTWNGSGSWYYSDPAAYPEPLCEEIPAAEGSDELPGWECVPDNPELPLPSAAQATTRALEAFQAVGLEATLEDVHVLADDEWGIGVSVSSRVNGQPTALEWTMFWAPGPVLASASGHSSKAVKRGNFDTISPFAAVDRLVSGSWWGAPAVDYDHLDSFHSHDGPLVTDGLLDGGPVTIISSTPTSLLVWDSSGGQWIVPGFFLSYGEEEWEQSAVISLSSDVLSIIPPAAPEPLTVSEGARG